MLHTAAPIGTLDVTIKILDANDHIPKFDNSTYTIRVAENFPVDQKLLTVCLLDSFKDSFKNRSYFIFTILYNIIYTHISETIKVVFILFINSLYLYLYYDSSKILTLLLQFSVI